jgi:hypothetical protein
VILQRIREKTDKSEPLTKKDFADLLAHIRLIELDYSRLMELRKRNGEVTDGLIRKGVILRGGA